MAKKKYLDEKGVEQISALMTNQQKELTQAEYNALTNEEKNNGTIYFITDGNVIAATDEHIRDVIAKDSTVAKIDESGNGVYIGSVTASDFKNPEGASIIPNMMIGATTNTAGTKGLIPAPAAGEQNKVLAGNGIWTLLNFFKPTLIKYAPNDSAENAGFDIKLGDKWLLIYHLSGVLCLASNQNGGGQAVLFGQTSGRAANVTISNASTGTLRFAQGNKAWYIYELDFIGN